MVSCCWIFNYTYLSNLIIFLFQTVLIFGHHHLETNNHPIKTIPEGSGPVKCAQKCSSGLLIWSFTAEYIPELNHILVGSVGKLFHRKEISKFIRLLITIKTSVVKCDLGSGWKLNKIEQST